MDLGPFTNNIPFGPALQPKWRSCRIDSRCAISVPHSLSSWTDRMRPARSSQAASPSPIPLESACGSRTSMGNRAASTCPGMRATRAAHPFLSAGLWRMQHRAAARGYCWPTITRAAIASLARPIVSQPESSQARSTHWIAQCWTISFLLEPTVQASGSSAFFSL